ncbi:aminoacyl-tRNA hydrolase [uncultured Ilyobacter sp.]|uniref:aminoacyl-tRNA hydrolase n=1 Tax=uncultured Ilyobacter sp. TaxID=544433 RepID=UPI0029C61A32|nr:aminoacyl-tRNA hydrolase [uncultured Ilyobacter sp.]
MKLIVGLGNPGEKYSKTRHNIGFDVIDMLAEDLKISVFREKFQGLIGEAVVKDEKVFLLKPQTFMNLSGNSINEVLKFYKINPAEDLIVIYDDMDLDLGKLKIRVKGSPGGHNGIKSIVSHIGENFIRLKCGIGKAKSREETVHFVLGRFSKEESEDAESMILDASKAAQSLITAKDISRVMQKYNQKK